MDCFLSDQVSEAFATANGNRVRAAAERIVPKAQAALRVSGMPTHLQRALRLRIEHPTRSLSDVASVAGLSKDQFAGQLRRALEFADRHGSQAPPTRRKRRR